MHALRDTQGKFKGIALFGLEYQVLVHSQSVQRASSLKMQQENQCGKLSDALLWMETAAQCILNGKKKKWPK